MNPLDCPHCGKPGIPILRKMTLGPAATARCEACGMKVGVPYTSVLSIVPFVAALFAATLVDAFAIKAALWIGGFVAMTFVHVRWIPLEPR